MSTPNTLKRVLMGPGPSDVDPRVVEALSRPTIGHLDPAFLDVLNEVRELLQYTFQTKNQMTFAANLQGNALTLTSAANGGTGITLILLLDGLYARGVQ